MACRYRFISENARPYTVQRLCRVLGAHRSGYTRWAADAQVCAVRAAADAELAGQIRAAHGDSRGTCGVQRIDVEIAVRREAASAGPVARKRIDRVMCEHRIQGRARRCQVATTVQDRDVRAGR